MTRAFCAYCLLAMMSVPVGCGLDPGLSKKTFKAVWINANWQGGRTGTPLEVKNVTPDTGVGMLCPAEALVLENHVSYHAMDPTKLWITNKCDHAISEVAVCMTASGSGGAAEFLRTCAVDPRETPADNLDIHHIGAIGSGPELYGDTPVDLDISVFYCSTGSHMNFGEVKYISPTDCVED